MGFFFFLVHTAILHNNILLHQIFNVLYFSRRQHALNISMELACSRSIVSNNSWKSTRQTYASECVCVCVVCVGVLACTHKARVLSAHVHIRIVQAFISNCQSSYSSSPSSSSSPLPRQHPTSSSTIEIRIWQRIELPLFRWRSEKWSWLLSVYTFDAIIWNASTETLLYRIV